MQTSHNLQYIAPEMGGNRRSPPAGHPPHLGLTGGGGGGEPDPEFVLSGLSNWCKSSAYGRVSPPDVFQKMLAKCRFPEVRLHRGTSGDVTSRGVCR